MSPFEQSRYGIDLWGDDVPERRRRRWRVEALQCLAVGSDFVLISLGALLAQWIQLVFEGKGSAGWSAYESTLSLGVLSSFLFIGFIALRGGYSWAALSDARRQALLVTQAWLFVFFALAWVAFLLKLTGLFSRASVSIDFLLGGATLVVAHGLGARGLAKRFVSGRLSLARVAVVAVCDQAGADRIRERLVTKGIEPVCLSTISPTRVGRVGFLSACCEAVTDVRSSLAQTRLDGICLFVSWRERRHIDELKAAMTPMPVPIYLFADRETEWLLSRPTMNVGDLRGFELQRAPLTLLDRFFKRSLDVAVSVTALLLLLPLLGLTSLAILMETGRPVLFRQSRKGFGARPFSILKFRSMTVQENGKTVTQASKNDMRVTRLGRILRRTSIDELPQLFNVLKGDMSIVGPRPHAVAHDDHYDGLIATYAFRQHVKPGITGWAQISGCRGETKDVAQMEARVEHDVWYINNWSIWLDIKIIFLTAAKIFFDKQAY